jgi:glycosyltransferase involved in cell wall biosynthesis
MADDEARVRRSVRARALARDYSWGTVAERLRALYASVMRR